MNGREILKRSLKAALGLIIFTVGDYMVIQANIGLPPWDCFSIGLSQKIGITRGQASIAVSIVILTLDLLMKEQIGIGTLLDTVICGTFLDLFTGMGFVPMQKNLLPGIIIMVAGMFIMSFGQYFYMDAGLCCGPRDSFLIAVGKRMRSIPIGAVDIMILAVVLCAGWLLGGLIGIGTLISAGGLGLAMQAVFHLMHFEPRSVRQNGFFGITKNRR
jgi:uncharacterized membrane protein YczE